MNKGTSLLLVDQSKRIRRSTSHHLLFLLLLLLSSLQIIIVHSFSFVHSSSSSSNSVIGIAGRFRSFIKMSSSNDAQMTTATTTNQNNDNNNDIRVLGICGGIGSGKSTVCRLLVEELGCIAHIDADSVAHSVYEPNSLAIKDIVKEFGSDVLQEDPDDNNSTDMIINRKKLGGIVFSDPKALSKLEHIVWPHVKVAIQKRIDDIKKDTNNEDNNKNNKYKYNIIILEAAILLDAQWDDICGGIWAIRTKKEIAIKRLTNPKTRNISIDDAKKRIAAQQNKRGIGNIEEEYNNNVITAIIDNNCNTETELITILQQTLEEKL